jgi:(2R)-3-sulfolactate dehydrogenase (NADP+)
MAAALTAANFGYEASSFFTADGPPPSVGQFLIAFDPRPFSGGAFEDRLEALLAAILTQESCRLPGERRLRLRRMAEAEGITISQSQEEQMLKLANKK